MEKASDDEGATLDDNPPDDASEGGLEFVEVDPTGRYGRYNEVLGKGAYKTVYKAFDEIDGIEVAWNQVKIYDVLHNAGDIERLYSELHLLKTLKHKNIIKFYNSWVDTRSRNVNFITEIFTSGTLRQYRKKHKNVKLRAIKNWSRQILRGLIFLHSREPPIIHRDLKCDNIFINGNTGEVKIGDLGLATILRRAPAAQSVIGTPEFMAPELYEEHYNELVDIYSFGMCLLEMLTSEYPYSECTNAAQIYKKVTTGKKPAALGKIKDPETREFVEKCLASASQRLHARELLMDPFLRSEEDVEMPDTSIHGQVVVRGLDTIPENVYLGSADSFFSAQRLDEVSTRNPSRNEGSPRLNAYLSERLSVLDPLSPKEGMKSCKDFRIKGRRQDDKKVLVRIRIASPGGEVRVIQFDFDVDADTAMSVASEMVAELDLSDQDVTTIADMIDAEIMALIPDWKPGLALDEAVDVDVGKEQNVVETPLIEEDGSSAGTPGTTVGPSDDLQLASGPTYGRFEEVGCNGTGSDPQQQESDGLGFFSDFSSEQFESSRSDSSLDAQSSYEIGVDNDLTIRSLEGVETVARSGSLPSLDDRPGVEGADAKEEHPLSLGSDEKLDDTEILRLIMQQEEELQVLRSKHEEALFDLKMRLNHDATASKVLELPKVSSLSEREVLEISGSLEGAHKDSRLEFHLQGAEAVADCNCISNGPPAVFDTAKGASLAILPQENSPLTDAMPILDSTRESHGMVAGEPCASMQGPLLSTSLHVVENTLVPLITGEESKRAPANAVVVGSVETKFNAISDKVAQVSKATTEHFVTETRSIPSNNEDVRPSTATLIKRESYLELYKASNSKDKVSSSKSSESLGTMDGTTKASIPKDANQEQLKKIADFAVKNIENLSQSKNKYLVNSSLKNVALQNGQQSGTGKNQGGATIQTGQQCAAAKNTPGATIQNGPRGVVVGNLVGAVVRNSPQSIAAKSTASAVAQNGQQGTTAKNPPGAVVQNSQQSAIKIVATAAPGNSQHGGSVKSTLQVSQQGTSTKSPPAVTAQSSQQSVPVKSLTGAPLQVSQQGSAVKITLGATLQNSASGRSLASSNVQTGQQGSTAGGHTRQQHVPAETTRA